MRKRFRGNQSVKYGVEVGEQGQLYGGKPAFAEGVKGSEPDAGPVQSGRS